MVLLMCQFLRGPLLLLGIIYPREGSLFSKYFTSSGVVSLDARPAVARKRIDFNLNSGLEVVANSSYHHPLEVEDNNKQPLSLSTNKLADCEQEEGEEAKSRKKMPSCLMPKAKE